MWAFPLIGLFIGAVSGLVLAVLQVFGIPPLASAGIALAISTLLTGGLHEDGLADMADGFGGGATRERKLEIMRDSRIGSYGVLALTLSMLIKTGALMGLASGNAVTIVFAMALAASYSRALIVWLMQTTPPARLQGLSASAGQPTQQIAIRALAIAVILLAVAAWGIGNLSGLLVAIGIATLSMLAIRHLALRQVGGQTGDVCGAVQVVGEILMLVCIAATVH